MKVDQWYNLGGQTGTEELTGTSTDVSNSANNFNVCARPNYYFFGSISNLSPLDINVKLIGFGSATVHNHDLRAYEEFKCKGLSIKEINFLINGTVKVHMMGVILIAENKAEEALLMSKGYMEEDLTDGRFYDWDTYDHIDIATATTTTIASPATGRQLVISKITVSVQAANRIEIRWTDSDGTSNARILATINFAGEGTYTLDLENNGRGYRNPRGQGGLLRAVTGSAGTIDIDVVGTEVDFQ